MTEYAQKIFEAAIVTNKTILDVGAALAGAAGVSGGKNVENGTEVAANSVGAKAVEQDHGIV